jgi:metal-sulfur cluster biosynthetic enzyme
MSTVDLERVHEALQHVVDPCSVGRGVPAGLADMGMVKGVRLDTSAGRSTVTVELRITSPACTFQPYFEREVHECLDTIEAVDEVQIEWDKTFDWSDDDMSESLKLRLREKQQRLLAIADVSSRPASLPAD